MRTRTDRYRDLWTAGQGFDNDLPLTYSPQHQAQEQALRAAVRHLEGPINSVLDVGCGRGRIAAFLQRELPKAKYTGLDVGPVQLELTRKVRPDGEFIQAAIQDLDRPDDLWELVVCSEILMHIPPDEIQAAVHKIKRAAYGYILIVEWVPTADWALFNSPDMVAWWNFAHDYLKLFGPAVYAARTDQQVVYIWKQ